MHSLLYTTIPLIFTFFFRSKAMPSLWTDQEGIVELKYKLLCKKFELESARIEAKETINKDKQTILQLLQLLKIAFQERDQARDQIHKILNKFFPSIPAETISLILPTKIIKASTPAIESNVSSQVNCTFDEVSSADMAADSRNLGFPIHPYVPDCVGSFQMGLESSKNYMVDHASVVIDSVVMGKALPQKGKLLQTVLEAGPLLQALLVPPLPQWRNPPPLTPFPVSTNSETMHYLIPTRKRRRLLCDQY